ncbi:hypothetical protein ASU35_05880 [Acetivibrio ethanolgignens]|uniref:Uncharacterized protein n=2 Tax=Acetivibrio ethanolgignens TaxID=290052 RepID=A0A0V8QIQ8_9FIRM|nr:hypothetical protein ASU35_05880 [Acetivibrio ethanolgignens]
MRGDALMEKSKKIIPPMPNRMNIFGRKRYSVEMNAVDYENYSFDDVWKAIGRLWLTMAIVVIMMAGCSNKK